jgi:iron complex outermembrane receptor protein
MHNGHLSHYRHRFQSEWKRLDALQLQQYRNFIYSQCIFNKIFILYLWPALVCLKNSFFSLFIQPIFMFEKDCIMPYTQRSSLKQIIPLLLFIVLPFTMLAQNKTVTGKVTNSVGGSPVQGATVSAKGTSAATQTGADGTFQVSVSPAAKKLVISFIGFAEQVVDIEGKSSVDVALTPVSTNLNDVVVIGYSTVRKADVTSSVSKVTEKEFNKGPFQSVDQLIQGKVPGLNISRSGNDPNATPSVILRGVGSFGGSTAPFYVIDGVPALNNEIINSISPDNIASVDVLKDASATAIYGTRGANGVIVITTKKAQAGQSFVSYNGQYGVDQVSKRFEVANTQQLRDYLSARGQSIPTGVDDKANTNWQEVIERTGQTQSHNLSFGGGTTNARFIASLNYFDQLGVIKTSSNNRLTGRINADFSQLNNKLRLGLQLLSGLTNSRYVNPSQALSNALIYSPAANVFTSDGKYRQTGQLGSFNPLSLLETFKDSKKGTTFSGTATMAIDVFRGFTYNLTATYQRDLQNGKVFATNEYPDQSGLSITNGINGTTGYQARQYENFNERKLLETYINYSKNIHSVTLRALAGYSWQNDQTDGFGAATQNIISSSTGANNLALSNPPEGYNGITSSNLDNDRLISFFGRLEAGFYDKYLITATYRRDGSNKFGSNNRWANFPAGSFAWKIFKENFMAGQKLFTDLKLRIGYGISGEKNLPNYASVYRYTNSGYGRFYYNGLFVPAIGLNNAFDPNPDLKWQSTYVLNGGIDYGFLQNRITGSLDFYKKNSKDLLYRVNVAPGTLGAGGQLIKIGRQWQNVGEVVNKGIEFQLNFQAVRGKEFNWNTSVNAAYNKGKIISVTANQNDSIDYSFIQGAGLTDVFTQRLYPGAELGTFYIYEWTGTSADGKQMYINGFGKTITGNNNLNNRRDQQAKFGSSLPKVTLGWSNNFVYKNFDLSISVRGQFGNKIMNLTALQLDRDPAYFSGKNVPVRYLNSANTEETPYPSTKYLESGNFVRIDNITLGYNLPKFSSKLKTFRIYVTVLNAAIITDYSGVDPELSLNFNQANDTGALAGGNDFNIYPKTRTYTFGLNVGL